jgi:hypothetical protein
MLEASVCNLNALEKSGCTIVSTDWTNRFSSLKLCCHSVVLLNFVSFLNSSLSGYEILVKFGTNRSEKITNLRKLCNPFTEVGGGKFTMDAIFPGSICSPFAKIIYPKNFNLVQPQQHLRN